MGLPAEQELLSGTSVGVCFSVIQLFKVKGSQNSLLLHFRVVESICQFCVAFCADSVDTFAAQVDVFELPQYSTNFVLFFLGTWLLRVFFLSRI